MPAALTKDKKRVHDHEISVHLAWESTLYVTNYPENVDDDSVRKLFAQVRRGICINRWHSADRLVVWSYFRRPVAEQEVQEHEEILLCSIHVSGTFSSSRVSDRSLLTFTLRRLQLGWRWNCTVGNSNQVSVLMFIFRTLSERRSELTPMQMLGRYMSLD